MNNDLDTFPGRNHSKTKSEKVRQHALYTFFHSYSLVNSREAEIQSGILFKVFYFLWILAILNKISKYQLGLTFCEKHHYKLFCDDICAKLSPVTCPPQHTHTMTPEGNTLLYLLLKSLLPPTLEVHTRSPPGIYEHSRGKRQRSLCRFKVTLPKTQNAKRLSQVYISAKETRFGI